MPRTDRGKRVLIYRLGSLGDTIVALPVFNKILESYPDAERIALTNRPVSSKAAPLEVILKDGGFIDRTIDYDVGLRNPRELWKLMSAIRHEKCDTLLYVGGGRGLAAVYRDILFFRACGVKHIIGAPSRKDLVTNRVDGKGVVEPEAARLARCVSALGEIDLLDPNVWDLRLTEAEKSKAKTILPEDFSSGFIAVNTGGKVVEKDWGKHNWVELIDRLSGKTQLPIVFVGGAEDSERATTLASRWRGKSLDLCGSLTPRESAAILKHASFFVGHDSGPMHLAAAMNIPCIGLFGSINRPRKWYPMGDHHVILHDIDNVENITVSAVYSAVEKLMLR